MTSELFTSGVGADDRQSYHPPISTAQQQVREVAALAEDAAGPPPVAAAALEAGFPVQALRFTPHNWPFQPLPQPKDPTPYRYDLSRLLTAADIQKIKDSGALVMHTVGDTGDSRGRQKDFVAAMMTADTESLGETKKPAFFYHLGDIVYFAGDVNMYGDNFYETYRLYPPFIVSIAGNHDCQPDDPQDGSVDPNKYPLDGWVKNFMSSDPTQVGSLKTGAGRTQMDLPNVFWTFTTPFATIIGLFSNVGENEGEIHQDQLDWFTSELQAADQNLALIVTVHHPPFSGDTEHSGSTAVYRSLFDSFAAARRYPHLILSGHVHNYQRFTHTVEAAPGDGQIACVVTGAGGYTHLGKLHKINGRYPNTPLDLGATLRLEGYDHDNFGFLRLEISERAIEGTYLSAPYSTAEDPVGQTADRFSINLAQRSVTTLRI
jgi:acid phosphatase type 7